MSCAVVQGSSLHYHIVEAMAALATLETIRVAILGGTGQQGLSAVKGTPFTSYATVPHTR